MTQTVTLVEALDFVERLPRENWKTLADIVQKRDLEMRRAEFLESYKESLQELERGEFKVGTVKDLMKEALECDE